MGLSPCLKFVMGGALTILSWDNPVTAYFRKNRKTAPQPWQAIAQRFCSLSVFRYSDIKRIYVINAFFSVEAMN